MPPHVTPTSSGAPDLPSPLDQDPSDPAFRGLMDRLPIAVLVVRWESPPDLGSFRFVYGNPAVQQVTHVPADHFTGFTIHEITPELLETELPARYARVAETGVPDIVRRFSWAPPNMAPEYFDLHLHRIAERTVWITYSNVSDATRTEIELRRQTEELESFAYVISHDLKAPLRGITNLARWIEEDHAESLEREARDHLRKIRERAVSMDELIDGVLAYSRIGRTPFLDPMPISTAALVKSVIASLDVPDDVTLTMVGSFPTVRHSEARLRQVFQNLIENALRFLGEEVRTVEIRCEERPLADGWEFSVRDTGIGIDPKHHERIFQMFQRLPNPSGSMPEVGTGIGLAVAKKAVEDCGGRMTVVSAPGRGSTFSFTVLRHPIRTASSSAVEKP